MFEALFYAIISAMRKSLTVVILCIFLLAGCTSGEPFDAHSFIDDCTKFVDVDSYETRYEFNIDFVDCCLDRFVRSQYYKNMTEEERLAAVQQIFVELETYSIPPLEDGCVRNVTYDERTGEFMWNYAYRIEYTGRWVMPS